MPSDTPSSPSPGSISPIPPSGSGLDHGLPPVQPPTGQMILRLFMVPALIVGVLVGLFLIQRWGTHRVGVFFGPVMALWFAAIAAAGLRQVVIDPSILEGLSPGHGASFLFAHPYVAFIAMGAIVLAITGAEALYADMGHFGRTPIRRAWFALVFPALTLNYLGQGGLILHSPKAIANPFFLVVPIGSLRHAHGTRRKFEFMIQVAHG